MKIAMANDHAGTRMKNEIKAQLEAMGHEVIDFGTYDENAADLPDYVYPAALAVAKGECDTDDIAEGSNNKYYTDARVQAKVETMSSTSLANTANILYVTDTITIDAGEVTAD